MGRPVLSIGMIFRNDIRSLEKCLKALEPLRKAVPCELVMADTGSTDGSREVAERYADILFDFAWINDFSAARNAVMERCSGVWYLTVDSDEYLDPDISELKRYVTAPKGRYPAYGGVIQRNYRTLEMREKDFTDFLALRLVRMDIGSHYEGTIHESFSLVPKETVCALQGTILHHDGYAKTDEAKHKEKMERNLALLREELKKDPKDPRRLLQCIESSTYHREEREAYIFQAMELLFNTADEKFIKNVYCRHLYRQAVCNALSWNLPESEEWLHWGEAHMADTISFRVDVCANAAVYYHGKHDYETALMWSQRYQAGCQDYDTGNYQIAEVSASAIACVRYYARATARMLQSDCLFHLEKQEEGGRILEELDFDWLSQEIHLQLQFLQLLPQMTECQEQAQVLCKKLLSPLWAPEDPNACWETHKARKKQRLDCATLANKLFQEEKWWVFLQAPGDLGIAARVMDIKEPAALTTQMEYVEQWQDVPIETLIHAIQCGAALPFTFYQLDGETLRTVATSLGVHKDIIPYLVSWTDSQNFRNSIHQTQFIFQLAAAALRGANWEDGMSLEPLSTLFLQVASSYIPELYNSALLQAKRNWKVLPGLHRFALYLLQAHRELRDGNSLGYVRSLKAALEAAPAMKNMIDFLLNQLKEKQNQSVSHDLLELAEKIRSILAQYPPDDPAVAALKQSEAYQRVAYLIEGMEAPSLSGLPQ